MPAKKAKIAVAFAVVAGLLVWLTISGFNENMQYYVTIEDLHAMPSTDMSQGLRVKGNLVAGSVEETPNSLEAYFTIEEEGRELRVRYDKERPDTFKDGSEILVEGQMTEEGYFDANFLMAKCPSKYETEEGEYDLKDYDPANYQSPEGTN